MFLEKRAAKGLPTKALDDRPSLYVDLGPIWQAFNELHSARPSGFGPMAIPVSEILAWMDLQGIYDRETRLEYYSLIRVMDIYWLKWAAKENESKKKKK